MLMLMLILYIMLILILMLIRMLMLILYIMLILILILILLLILLNPKPLNPDFPKPCTLRDPLTLRPFVGFALPAEKARPSAGRPPNLGLVKEFHVSYHNGDLELIIWFPY